MDFTPQLVDGAYRIGGGDQALTDEDGVVTGIAQGPGVVAPADPGLGHLHHPTGDGGGHAHRPLVVDLERWRLDSNQLLIKVQYAWRL